MQNRPFVRFALVFCLLIDVAGLVGCNKSTGSVVFGKVSLDGKPLEDGDISFSPDTGTPGSPSSAPIKHGEYRLGEGFGLAQGTYVVRINGYRPPTDKS